jgi:aminoglycoside 6'-N-acetyltransferase I
MEVIVRRAAPADLDGWVRMRDALWPGSLTDHQAETAAHFARSHDWPVVFVAEASGSLVGFLELGLRSYAEGCTASPVPFIEGWFVEPAHRRRGVGRALVQAAESHAIGHGFTEMASDAELGNTLSHAAHRALGYDEVERIVCFRRGLNEST